MGELKDVMIQLASNSKVHQVIDVTVVHIPEAYGLILSRDWSAKLNGYFATDWSHLCYHSKVSQTRQKLIVKDI